MTDKQSYPLSPIASTYRSTRSDEKLKACGLLQLKLFSQTTDYLSFVMTDQLQKSSTSSKLSQFITIIALTMFPFRSRCLLLCQHKFRSSEKVSNLHPVKFVALNTHVPCTKMLYFSFGSLPPNRVLKCHKCLVPLTD